MPVFVSIFVYIAVASAVNSLAFGGSCRCLSSDSRCLESFIYDGIRKRRSFILKSNQLLKIDRKLFMQLTTGRSVVGFL
jgi:hypothetical protein